MAENADYKAGEEKGLILGKLVNLEGAVSDIKIQLNNLTQGIGSRIEKQEAKVGELDKHSMAQSTKIKNVEEKIADLEGSRRWISYLVIGTVVLSIIAMVLRR